MFTFMDKALVGGIGTFLASFPWQSIDYNAFVSSFVTQGWKSALLGLVTGFVTFHIPNKTA